MKRPSLFIMKAMIIIMAHTSFHLWSQENAVRIYRGHAQYSATATTLYGNRATASCSDNPQVTVTVYANGQAELYFEYRKLFEGITEFLTFDREETGPTHGNIHCTPEDWLDPWGELPYLRRQWTLKGNQDSFTWHDDNEFLLTYDEAHFAGSYERDFEKAALRVFGINGLIAEYLYAGHEQFTFDIPLVWEAKLGAEFEISTPYVEFGKEITVDLKLFDAEGELLKGDHTLLLSTEHDAWNFEKEIQTGSSFDGSYSFSFTPGSLDLMDLADQVYLEGEDSNAARLLSMDRVTFKAEVEALGLSSETSFPLGPPLTISLTPQDEVPGRAIVPSDEHFPVDIYVFVGGDPEAEGWEDGDNTKAHQNLLLSLENISSPNISAYGSFRQNGASLLETSVTTDSFGMGVVRYYPSKVFDFISGCPGGGVGIHQCPQQVKVRVTDEQANESEDADFHIGLHLNISDITHAEQPSGILSTPVAIKAFLDSNFYGNLDLEWFSDQWKEMEPDGDSIAHLGVKLSIESVNQLENLTWGQSVKKQFLTIFGSDLISTYNGSTRIGSIVDDEGTVQHNVLLATKSPRIEVQGLDLPGVKVAAEGLYIFNAKFEPMDLQTGQIIGSSNDSIGNGEYAFALQVSNANAPYIKFFSCALSPGTKEQKILLEVLKKMPTVGSTVGRLTSIGDIACELSNGNYSDAMVKAGGFIGGEMLNVIDLTYNRNHMNQNAKDLLELALQTKAIADFQAYLDAIYAPSGLSPQSLASQRLRLEQDEWNRSTVLSFNAAFIKGLTAESTVQARFITLYDVDQATILDASGNKVPFMEHLEEDLGNLSIHLERRSGNIRCFAVSPDADFQLSFESDRPVYLTIQDSESDTYALFQWLDSTLLNGSLAITPNLSESMVIDENGDGAVDSFIPPNMVQIGNTSLAPIVTRPPSSLSLQIGDRATFSVQASGDTPLHYEWFKDGRAIRNSNLSEWVIQSVSESDAGSYSVEVSNEVGSVMSDTATLEVSVQLAESPTEVEGTVHDGNGGPWTLQGSPYIVRDTVMVPEDTTLTIHPGVEVRFDNREGMEIFGSLQATGNENQKILFTSNQEEAERGNWNSVYFQPDSGISVMEHCIVEYAGRDDANIIIEGVSTVRIHETTSRESNNDGIKVFEMADPVITHCRLMDNDGSGMAIEVNSYPFLRNNTMLDNEGWNGMVIIGGHITRSGTWYNNGLPYVVDDSGSSSGNRNIEEDVTLTIQSGTVIKFENRGTCSINVLGTLLAEGTLADPIIFTSVADDSADDHDTNGDGTSNGSPADWEEITFRGNDQASRLVHCTLRFAGEDNSTLSLLTDSVVVEDCKLLDGDAAGILIEEAGPTLTRVEVERHAHEGLYVDSGNGVVISESTFRDNLKEGIECEESEITIVDCTIENNGEDHRYDGILIRNQSGAVIENCHILRNHEDGIDAGGDSWVQVRNCVISQNGHADANEGYGIGLYSAATGIIEDCEITDNIPRDGILLRGGENIIVRNTTITGHQADGIYADDTDASILHCFIKNNRNSGIDCDGSTLTVKSCQIIENGGDGNHQAGIYMHGNSTFTISQSSIVDNEVLGVENTSNQEMNASDNWWGTASGPFHEQLNPDGEGNSVSDNVLFSPYVRAPNESPPILVTQPVSVIAAIGERVTFHIEATGAIPLRYQWYHDDRPISGGTTANLILDPVSETSEGDYWVRVSNDEGSVDSQRATLTLGTSPVEGIPPGVIPFQGHHYLFVNTLANWDDATSHADALGGSLATVLSQEENQFLVQEAENAGFSEPFWIGLTDEDNEGVFRWITGEPVVYRNWHSGEPNNSDGIEDYVIIGHHTQDSWNDSDSESEFPYVIEFGPIAEADQIIGHWDFEGGDLRAIVGESLIFSSSYTAQNSSLASSSQFDLTSINGTHTGALHVPELSEKEDGYWMPIPKLSHLEQDKINQYTLIFDLYYPSESRGNFTSLIQINDLTNDDDGDFFINTANKIGINGNYHGELNHDTWHRIGFVVDQSNQVNEIRKYIDGNHVGTQSADREDGRFGLLSGRGAILFGDDTSEVSETYVSCIQLRSGLLNNADMAALGGASANGIPIDSIAESDPVRITEISVTQDQLLIRWSGQSQTFELQHKTRLSDSRWTVITTTQETSAIVTMDDKSGFFRVTKTR